jgi:hypothetical protein
VILGRFQIVGQDWQLSQNNRSQVLRIASFFLDAGKRWAPKLSSCQTTVHVHSRAELRFNSAITPGCGSTLGGSDKTLVSSKECSFTT